MPGLPAKAIDSTRVEGTTIGARRALPPLCERSLALGRRKFPEFSIFDITTWNPNVALELGIAVGAEVDYYIAFNSTIEQEGVPADVGGIDRLEYEDYASLGQELERLMTQQFGGPVAERDAKAKEQAEEFRAQLESLSNQIPEVVKTNPGLAIGGIASQIGVPLEITQTLVRSLVGSELRTEGDKRGTKYYPAKG
jgi:hypothetical protein